MRLARVELAGIRGSSCMEWGFQAACGDFYCSGFGQPEMMDCAVYLFFIASWVCNLFHLNNFALVSFYFKLDGFFFSFRGFFLV